MASKAGPKDAEAAETTVVGTFLRQAYQLYVKKRVRQDLILPALRILATYTGTHGLVREPEALFAAALYIAFRHPNTYPNLVPRKYFSAQTLKRTKRQPTEPLFEISFNAKDSSIDWYVKQFVDKLGMISLYDERGLPYFLERTGPIYNLIDTLAEEAAIDAVLISHVKYRPELLESIVSELLNRILNVLRLLPKVFRPSLYEEVAPHVEALIENSRWALGL